MHWTKFSWYGNGIQEKPFISWIRSKTWPHKK